MAARRNGRLLLGRLRLLFLPPPSPRAQSCFGVTPTSSAFRFFLLSSVVAFTSPSRALHSSPTSPYLRLTLGIHVSMTGMAGSAY